MTDISRIWTTLACSVDRRLSSRKWGAAELDPRRTSSIIRPDPRIRQGPRAISLASLLSIGCSLVSCHVDSCQCQGIEKRYVDLQADGSWILVDSD
jgi:hypothetical protein